MIAVAYEHMLIRCLRLLKLFLTLYSLVNLETNKHPPA